MYMRRTQGVHEGSVRCTRRERKAKYVLRNVLRNGNSGTETPEYSGVDGQPQRVRSEVEMAYSPRKISEISGEVQRSVGEVRSFSEKSDGSCPLTESNTVMVIFACFECACEHKEELSEIILRFIIDNDTIIL
jgi:hypothetical protein